jgi:hypothetical protein
MLRQVEALGANKKATSGALSATAHYRIVGDQLDIVSLVTGRHGGIRFSVPIAGKLNAPEFS